MINTNNENLISLLFLIRNEIDELIDLIQSNKLATDGTALNKIQLDNATIIFNNNGVPSNYSRAC